MADNWTRIPFEKIRLHQNYRRLYPKVKELAGSILEHGLLENLVVQPFDNEFELVAGYRRYHALSILREDGKWEQIPGLSDGVPVRVISEQAEAIAIAENEIRVNVAPWYTGIRLAAMNDGGQSYKDLAAAVGKSQAWVQRYVQYGRFIHPNVMRQLDRLGMGFFTLEELDDLSRLTQGGVPDEKAQAAFVEKDWATRKVEKHREKEGRKEKQDSLVARFNRLKQMRRGEPSQAIIDAFVRFLSGVDSDLVLPDELSPKRRTAIERRARTEEWRDRQSVLTAAAYFE